MEIGAQTAAEESQQPEDGSGSGRDPRAGPCSAPSHPQPAGSDEELSSTLRAQAEHK